MDNLNINVNLDSLADLLTTIFGVLKLLGAVSWPWWVVLLPSFVVVGVTIVLYVVMLLVKLVGWCWARL